MYFKNPLLLKAGIFWINKEKCIFSLLPSILKIIEESLYIPSPPYAVYQRRSRREVLRMSNNKKSAQNKKSTEFSNDLNNSNTKNSKSGSASTTTDNTTTDCR